MQLYNSKKIILYKSFRKGKVIRKKVRYFFTHLILFREIREICKVFAEQRTPSPKSKRDPERSVELEFFDKEIPAFDLDDLLRAFAFSC